MTGTPAAPDGDPIRPVGPDQGRPPLRLSARERRLLAAAAGVLAAAEALVQIVVATGERPSSAVIVAAITILAGGVVLVGIARLAPLVRKTFPVSYLVAGSVLVLAGTLGGFAGYGLSTAFKPGPATKAAPPPNTSLTQSAPASRSPAISPSATPDSGPSAIALPRGIHVARHLTLNAANFCSWRLGSRPTPLASISPVRIRIDGRCNYPEDPNPRTDGPTGVYSNAYQDPSYAVARLRDGTILRLDCFARGQEVSDASGNQTSIWLGVTLPAGARGYVPDVNAGNYSALQLKQLGIRPCT
jgi:hypothetical protein